MAKLNLTLEESVMPAASVDPILIGKALRQFLKMYPDMHPAKAATFIAAGLNIVLHAQETGASDVDAFVTLSGGDKWHIQISEIEVTQ